MPATDECSRHNMPRGMEDDGCSKSFVSKRFVSKSSDSNAITCPSPVYQNTTYGAPQLDDASYDRRRNDQGLSPITLAPTLALLGGME
jgi:hypothetical protein